MAGQVVDSEAEGQAVARLEVWRLGGVVDRKQEHSPFEDGSAIALADLPSGVTVIEDPAGVEVYRRLFDQTWDDAHEGAEATQLLDAIAADHRRT